MTHTVTQEARLPARTQYTVRTPETTAKPNYRPINTTESLVPNPIEEGLFVHVMISWDVYNPYNSLTVHPRIPIVLS
jgi:hypothetical protein